MKENKDKNGLFIISLDFELFWGVWDAVTIERYGGNVLGVRNVIPQLLSLFSQFNIRATFATVGFLFAKNKAALHAACPALKPDYTNSKHNVYINEIHQTGNDETDDPYHFGGSLFEMVKNSAHEIGSHTFSHYYCLEEGQTLAQFSEDIKAAVNISGQNNIRLRSFVFPRNQVNPHYLPVLAANGFTAYRGNPNSWVYKPRRFVITILMIRLFRLIDTYLPVSGSNTHKINKAAETPANIPASRFLKPYSSTLWWLEHLKMWRIKKEMTRAAKKKEIYHLWWHPHNFGKNTEKNIAFLAKLLAHYKVLQNRYGFTNVTMQEAADIIISKK